MLTFPDFGVREEVCDHLKSSPFAAAIRGRHSVPYYSHARDRSSCRQPAPDARPDRGSGFTCCPHGRLAAAARHDREPGGPARQPREPSGQALPPARLRQERHQRHAFLDDIGRDARHGAQLRRCRQRIQGPARNLHRQLGPSRYQPRRRTQPRGRDREHGFRDLQQVRFDGLRSSADQHALERLRRHVPGRQRRRPDREVRLDRQPLGDQPVRHHFAQSQLPAVRRRFDDRRPDWHLLPLFLQLRQPIPGLPEDGSLAGRLLHHLQHVQLGRQHLPRRKGVRLRPHEHAVRCRRHPAVFRYGHHVRRTPAVRSGRFEAGAGRLTELHRRRRGRFQPAGLLELSHRLDHPGQHDADRPHDAGHRRVHTTV